MHYFFHSSKCVLERQAVVFRCIVIQLNAKEIAFNEPLIVYKHVFKASELCHLIANFDCLARFSVDSCLKDFSVFYDYTNHDGDLLSSTIYSY